MDFIKSDLSIFKEANFHVQGSLASIQSQISFSTLQDFFPLGMGIKDKAIYFTPPFTFDSSLHKIVENTTAPSCYHLTDPLQVLDLFKRIACQLILKKCYNIPLDIIPGKVNLWRTLQDLDQEHHYAAELISDFIEVSPKIIDETLDEKIRELVKVSDDLDPLLSIIPIENYSFKGLHLWVIQDATKEEITRQFRELIIYRGEGQTSPSNQVLESKLSAALGLKDLKLNFHHHSPEFLGEGVSAIILEEIKNSILFLAMEEESPLVIKDFSSHATDSLIDQGILNNHKHSLLLLPVFKGKSPIEVIKISHPEKNIFSNAQLEEFSEIFLLLTLHMKNQQNERENNIRSIIQRYYTNIHPSVQWKFNEAALHLYMDQKKGNILQKGVPLIEFHKVYALYSQTDIISSSEKRNKSIQKDLLATLNLAYEVLNSIEVQESRESRDFQRKIKKYIDALSSPLDSKLEALITDFFSLELNPFLRKWKKQTNKVLELPIDEYFEKTESKSGIIYHHLKVYEDSVNRLNRHMLNILQEENQNLQEILPHYIQHYTTDGVEFDIYLGQALLEEKRFDSTHLNEFRYWQLKLMCKITYEAEELKNSLPIPLTTAQLILWYSNPIDISFRPDEKKFDVKGSHSIQYEIIKKRIDKALIYGSRERLTSNGKIAIVYLKPEDKSEIRKACLQLAEEGLIHHEIEELDLEDMKGIRGLKAIRVRKI